MEDGYTQELMVGDDREQELRKQVARLEDQVTTFSSSYSYISTNQGFGSVFILIRHFRLNADPDPIRIQGFYDQQLKKYKILKIYFCGFFALLDPDFEYGSGSTDLIESGSNPVPDPKPWYKLIIFSWSRMLVFLPQVFRRFITSR